MTNSRPTFASNALHPFTSAILYATGTSFALAAAPVNHTSASIKNVSADPQNRQLEINGYFQTASSAAHKQFKYRYQISGSENFKTSDKTPTTTGHELSAGKSTTLVYKRWEDTAKSKNSASGHVKLILLSRKASDYISRVSCKLNCVKAVQKNILQQKTAPISQSSQPMDTKPRMQLK